MKKLFYFSYLRRVIGRSQDGLTRTTESPSSVTDTLTPNVIRQCLILATLRKPISPAHHYCAFPHLYVSRANRSSSSSQRHRYHSSDQ